jgi:protein Mpv17
MFRHNLKALVGNSVTFGSILTAAEYSQRKLETWKSTQKKPDDLKTLWRHAFVGSCVIGPLLHTYYRVLDAYLPGVAVRTVALKVASDVLGANIVYYGLFYFCLSYLEHRDVARAEKDVSKAFGITYIAGMLYWIPVMALNFRWVSPRRRLLFIAFATYIEQNGLCLMRRKSQWQSQ